jgi:hypothetical protein
MLAWEDTNWIHLAEDDFHWLLGVNTVIVCRVSQNAANFWIVIRLGSSVDLTASWTFEESRFGAGNLCLFYSIHVVSGGLSQSHIHWVPVAASPVVNRPGSETNRSHS